MADMKWLPTARDLQLLGVTNAYDFFAKMKGVSRRRRSSVMRKMRRRSQAVALARKFRKMVATEATEVPLATVMMAPLPDWQPGREYSTQATKLSEALAIVKSQRHLPITAVAAKAGSTGDGEEQKQEAPAEPGTSDDVASQRPVSPPPPDFPTLQVASRRPQTQSELMLKGEKPSAPVSLVMGAMCSFPGLTFCVCFLL